MGQKVIWFNILVLAMLGLAAFTLDATLTLGTFHGLVFSLYFFYGAVLLGIINLGLFIYRWIKKPMIYAYLWSALLMPAIAITVILLAHLN